MPTKATPEEEVIPDSEEELVIREKERTDDENYNTKISTSTAAQAAVIVISSDSEEEPVGLIQRAGSGSDNPFLAKLPSAPTRPDKQPKRKVRPVLPRIESDSDSSIICISDAEHGQGPSSPSASPVKQTVLQRTPTLNTPIVDQYDSDLASDDSAILTFDPHSRAKPILLVSKGNPDPKLKDAPKSKAPASVPSTPRKPKKVPPEQLRLEKYAKTLFAELNEIVFANRIPHETELVWNKRLMTTAGRASWSRNRHGESTSKIELSQKVVDSDERVRSTLAHEMCHLAVWVLDCDPQERGHGRQFKAWSARVMKLRPDIKINTRHTYEIHYEYTWECCTCGKIYGRHSRSIDPTKMACGVCQTVGSGRLKPLFETRPRKTPTAASKSKLASGSPRESPRSMDRTMSSTTKLSTLTTAEEVEVEELIKSLGDIGL